MQDNTNENYIERVERYCSCIGKNTILNRQRNKEGALFECENADYCAQNGGCKNRMCVSYKDEE